MKQFAAAIKTGDSHWCKRKRNKIKIGIYTGIFLVEFFADKAFLSFQNHILKLKLSYEQQIACQESILTFYVDIVILQSFVKVFNQNR